MIVDLRSDTVTRPTPAMRAAIAEAIVGDDVFGDDPTINALEAEVAALLGKEAAVLVPSGTMANQLALRCHTRHGDEVILHLHAHIYEHESGAAAALAGVQTRTLDSADGSLPLELVQSSLHLSDDPHAAPTTLIAFENTMNGCGGVVLPPTNVSAVAALARRHCIALHLDGARLFNASVASGRPVAELAAEFDTVSICLSKGLGAPVGSVLSGSAAAIARARRFRKMYGGGMRQAGLLAAAGRYALANHVERLADDHLHARALADAIAEIGGLSLPFGPVQTNLVYFDIDSAHPLAALTPQGWPKLVNALHERGVWILGFGTRMRAVTHLDVDDAGLSRAIEALRGVMAAA